MSRAHRRRKIDICVSLATQRWDGSCFCPRSEMGTMKNGIDWRLNLGLGTIIFLVTATPMFTVYDWFQDYWFVTVVSYLAECKLPALAIRACYMWGNALVFVPSLLVSLYACHRISRRTLYDEFTRCRKCHHILRGLSEPRCPECGTKI